LARSKRGDCRLFSRYGGSPKRCKEREKALDRGGGKYLNPNKENRFFDETVRRQAKPGGTAD